MQFTQYESFATRTQLDQKPFGRVSFNEPNLT